MSTHHSTYTSQMKCPDIGICPEHARQDPSCQAVVSCSVYQSASCRSRTSLMMTGTCSSRVSFAGDQPSLKLGVSLGHAREALIGKRGVDRQEGFKPRAAFKSLACILSTDSRAPFERDTQCRYNHVMWARRGLRRIRPCRMPAVLPALSP